MTRPTSLLLVALLTACGADRAPTTDKPPVPAPSPAPAPAPTPTKAEPFATPKAKPPPPPDGATLIDPPLYVQRCDAEQKCPELLQPAGETHCRELRLGGLTGWRLPDREEVKRFATGVGLEKVEGFHWTRSAYAEDAAQVWIVDPKTGQETTIPRTRKPFTIRCVFVP